MTKSSVESILNMEHILESYMYASTPSWIFNRLIDDPSIQKLSRLWTIQEMADEYDRRTQRSRTPQDVAIAYALILAALLQQHQNQVDYDLMAFAKFFDLNELDWGEKLFLRAQERRHQLALALLEKSEVRPAKIVLDPTKTTGLVYKDDHFTVAWSPDNPFGFSAYLIVEMRPSSESRHNYKITLGDMLALQTAVDVSLKKYEYCVFCGMIANPGNYGNPGADDIHSIGHLMAEKHCCFECAYWMQWMDRTADLSQKWYQNIIVDGVHYCCEKPGIETTPSYMRGFAGQHFHIRHLESGDAITTNNLWGQGAIPDRFRNLFPDNAEFIPLDEDKELMELVSKYQT